MLQQKQQHTSSHMTYYIEIQESSGSKPKRSFGRATLMKNGTRRIEKLKDQNDADETVHKRATSKNYSDSIVFFV